MGFNPHKNPSDKWSVKRAGSLLNRFLAEIGKILRLGPSPIHELIKVRVQSGGDRKKQNRQANASILKLAEKNRRGRFR